MQNARSRFMAGLAGLSLCLFAATSYGQAPTTTSGAPEASAQTTAQPTTPATPAPSGTTADPIVPGPTADVVAATETTTETWSYPGGFWGILATVLLGVLILFAVFRRRDTTVVNETYVTPNTGPAARNAGVGTAFGDRNLSPRAASGTEPGTRAGIDDPNTRGGLTDPGTRGGINDPGTRGGINDPPTRA